MVSLSFEEGLQAFQREEYYEAHEIWEELWSDPALADRRILQGFIQVAVSVFHAYQGNLKGARSMVAKALSKWESAPALWHRISMPEFIQSAQHWAEHLHYVNHIEEVDFSRTPKVRTV
ncbi:MAG: DUF309 domain-containing protein [Fidelibacterota bacterium]